MSPARSVDVTFKNETDSVLTLIEADLDHGIWTVQPPATIEPDQTVQFSSESSGIATGTEGRATYQHENLATVAMHWDNPFAGGNSYDASVSDPIWHRVVSTGNGNGNNSSITWTLQETSTQRDGIPDDWKLNGAFIDDGTGNKVFVDLPKMGARVDQTDVFIQIDFMQDAMHSHALSATAIKQVHDAFLTSPYTSRAGVQGIRIHIDAGPNSIMNFDTNETWGSLSRARAITEVANFGTTDASGNYDWTDFDTEKNATGGFTRSGRTGIFHYCISMHQFSNFPNSGLARPASRGPGGNDFIISLAPISATPSDMNQAGTFMHELGHNLGLDHGGIDGVNYKPNYISVMNYLFQLNGITKNGVAGVCDYSGIALPDLNEKALNEPAGLGPAAAGLGTFRWSPGSGGFFAIADASQAIDWDDDGTFEAVSTQFDINNDGIVGTSASLLKGCNDWTTIKLKTANIGGGSGAAGGEHVMASKVDETLTKQTQALIQPLDTTPPVTTAVLDPPPNAAGWNRTAVRVTLNATDDISGAVFTHYKIDSDQEWTVARVRPGPVSFLVEGEGTHTVQFFSTDRAQNAEAVQSIVIKIDLTPPEAVISYDSSSHQILVHATDSLSGTYFAGAVAPSTVAPAVWRAPAADTAETRTYSLQDIAGNKLDLTMQVRRQGNEYELNVVSLKYDPPAVHARLATSRLQKNTIQFRRVMPGTCCKKNPRRDGDGDDDKCGCDDKGKCVLAVLQRMIVAGLGGYDGGKGVTTPTSRVQVEAEWDILHDETNIKVGSPKDDTGIVATTGGKGKNGNSDRGPTTRCFKICGLWTMRILTTQGKLTIDSTGISDASAGDKSVAGDATAFMLD